MSAKQVRQSVLEHVVGFSRALHEAALTVNPGNLLDLCQCFEHIDITRRDDFYAAARATLLSRREDIPRFDAVFTRYWEAPRSVAIKRRKEGDEEALDKAKSSRSIKLLLPSENGDNDTGTKKSLKLAYSADEALALRDLGTLTDADVERARRLIRAIVAALANKRGRRQIARRSGCRPDFRRLLRSRAFYTADGICPLPWKGRRLNKTRLVLLCDVSGSMQRYSSFLIEFMFALRRELSDLEVAVFSTRLTVITQLLRRKGVAASLQLVANQVADWAGGTDIGNSLHQFNQRYAPHMIDRHTAVIFLSDGWDRGDPVLMRNEMASLSLRAQKVLWLNPLLGTPGYQPLTRGMQCALPYLDFFLPANNLESLAQLAHTLQTIGA